MTDAFCASRSLINASCLLIVLSRAASSFSYLDLRVKITLSSLSLEALSASCGEPFFLPRFPDEGISSPVTGSSRPRYLRTGRDCFWGFPVRILRGIAILLFHHILAGIIRTFIAIPISVLFPFPAKNDLTVLGAKIRLVVIRPIAALTGIIFNQSLRADITVQTAGSYHFCFEHFTYLRQDAHPSGKPSPDPAGTALPASPSCALR